MAKISLQELATLLAEKHGLEQKETRSFVGAIFEVIQQGIESDKLLKIKGLGTFKIIGVDARESVNVNTGERVVIESHEKVTFTPDSIMKELVNKPFSQFETVVLSDNIDINELEGGIIEEEPEPIIEEEEPVVEKESEPLIEEEPEPVIEEEEPEPAIEEIMEPDILEEEPVVEETPVNPVLEVDFLEQVAEEEPVEEEPHIIEEEEPVEEPIIEEPVEEIIVDEEPIDEEPPVEEEPIEEEPVEEEPLDGENDEVENEEEEIYQQEERTTSHKWVYWLLGMIAVGVLAFAGGYYLGRMSNQPAQVTPKQEQPKKAPAPKPVAPVDTVAKKDTTATQAVKVVEQAPKAEKPTTPEPVVQQEDYMKYNNMDVRLKTGAYYIMGTDRVVKAREGERTSTIARKVLGEGMECYIEVYNNLSGSTVLKEGQEIKVPKIKLKKLVNKQKKSEQTN